MFRVVVNCEMKSPAGTGGRSLGGGATSSDASWERMRRLQGKRGEPARVQKEKPRREDGARVWRNA